MGFSLVKSVFFSCIASYSR